jgi:formate C-acetyltransferase
MSTKAGAKVQDHEHDLASIAATSWMPVPEHPEVTWLQPGDTVESYNNRLLPSLRYDGDSSFLAGATDRTKALMVKVNKLMAEELKKDGCYAVDNKIISGITAFPPGYIDKHLELIVGLQTDVPLKRAMKPFGGWRMVQQALESFGSTMEPRVKEIFTKYRKTHNEAVFDIYNKEIRLARSNKLLTGLPDAYGRGRIIGDYRRVALFGVDKLIADKKADKKKLDGGVFDEHTMQLREEISDQIKSLGELKEMAKSYGYDISQPATTARTAVQWLYFGYLAAIKEQDGAAMSLGRVDTFLDSFIQRDLDEGRLTEDGAQELIDDFVIKLRMARHLRTPDYNELFAGDPTWVTAVLGGMGADGGHAVTKTSYRILQTLYNLGISAEPNITLLWSPRLPQHWKQFCAKTSIDSSSTQYENDDLMSAKFGTDYGIACCVSAMAIGKQMQYFGARANLPKLLLYAMNGGKDELSGEQVAPALPPLPAGPLKYEDVLERFDTAMDWLAKVYAQSQNAIHYSHDKYNYERVQMALQDSDMHRFMAFGASGISIIADSLSAIKHAKVTPVRNEAGLTTSFEIEGEYPKFGNDKDEVDSIAEDVVHRFMEKLRAQPLYRANEPTLSLLTITSNVVYGKGTGSTPDGRLHGEAFAPGANPMHSRDERGALASLNSVAKLPYEDCMDGISNTFTIVPQALGKSDEDRQSNLSALLDGYFSQNAHHLNVNVLNREMLIEASEHPEKYPQLCVRVSGYW